MGFSGFFLLFGGLAYLVGFVLIGLVGVIYGIYLLATSNRRHKKELQDRVKEYYPRWQGKVLKLTLFAYTCGWDNVLPPVVHVTGVSEDGTYVTTLEGIKVNDPDIWTVKCNWDQRPTETV